MALPLRLIVGLQMPLSRKVSIAALFCLGFVCIIASTIRVTQINNGARQPTVPWLALWGTVEAAVAVVIANSPNLYRTIKRETSRAKYYAGRNGYEKEGDGSTTRPRLATVGTVANASSAFRSRNRGTVNDNMDDVELKSIGGSNSSQNGDGSNNGTPYHGGNQSGNGPNDPHNSSQEGLVDDMHRNNANGINVSVTTTKKNPVNRNGEWTGGGILVTNTYVTQRTEAA